MESTSNVSFLERAVNAYFGALKVAMGICLIVMVVLVFGNVVLRYAFNSGITISEELSRWFFVWMVFLGALLGLRANGHLGFDMLLVRLSPMGRRICLVLSRLLMLGVVLLLLKGGWAQMLINMDVEAPASGLKMGIYFHSVMVLFAVTAIPMLAAEIVLAITGRTRDSDLIKMAGSTDAVHEDHSGSSAKH